MSNAERATQAELPEFVARSRAQLQQLLERLQWTEQRVLQLHRPDKGKELPAHVEQLPPSCPVAPEHSVQLSAAQLQKLLGPVPQVQLLPKTFADLQANFSASQRLLIYEHVRQCTPQQPTNCQTNVQFAQLVAQTKKAHQQQRRYRKSKPTLQEEMHQLVELQMQALLREHQQQAAVSLASWQQPQIVCSTQRGRHLPQSSIQPRTGASSVSRTREWSNSSRKESTNSSRRESSNSSRRERSNSSRRERSNSRRRERSNSSRRERSSSRMRKPSYRREKSICRRERSISRRERSISRRERSISSRRSSNTTRRRSRSRQRHSSKRSHRTRSPAHSPGHTHRQHRPQNN